MAHVQETGRRETEEKQMASFRRRKFLVVVPFQMRFVAFRIILLLILSLTLWIFVFFPLQLQVIGDLQNASHGIPETNLPIPHLDVLIGVAVIFLLMGAMAVFESHRIAGPIYRFEKMIRALIAGNFSDRVVLRKYDNFTHVGPLLNELSEKMAQAARSDQFVRDTIVPELKSIEALCQRGSAAEAAAKLNALGGSIRQVLGEQA
jgi:hypothetical protein